MTEAPRKTAQAIDGKALSLQLRTQLSARVQALKIQNCAPALAVILVGEDPASAVYVRNKVLACEAVGIQSVQERYPVDMTQEALLARIAELNSDPSIHGILVQLPLPAHMQAQKVIEAIAPAKDVDGFHVSSAGALLTGLPGFWPCTPHGCMRMLESIGYDLAGKHAVVIGRSNIVGKPMALMLLQKNATVTICHSATADLKHHTLLADVIVAAAGRPKMLTADMVKPGAVVLDVGINRLADGSLCGDVDFASVQQVAAYISPVPGGVGPMTIAMLLENTLDAAQNSIATAQPDATGNPLQALAASSTGFAAFDQIQPAHITPALDALLAQAEAAMQTVCAPSFVPTWDALARILDTATEALARAWGVVEHLSAVCDTPALREAQNQNLPRISAFWAQMGASETLYQKYLAIDTTTLNAEQKRALHLIIQGFELGGAKLQGEAKARFTAIQERLSELAQKFSENVLDATDGYQENATLSELEGVPVDIIEACRSAYQNSKDQAGEQPKAEAETLVRLSLKSPIYVPIMQFAHSRDLRERLYYAYVTRASELGSSQWDNSAIMDEIRALRQEEAQLLGFANYAGLSLSTKMAKNAEDVLLFLRDLASRARPYAEQDVADLRAYARTHLQLEQPQSWDWAYIGERLKENRYAFSEQEVKAYFPLPTVIEGLFELVENLFSIRISPAQTPTWHPDVHFYQVDKDNTTIAHFYLDPSARTGKRGGAWMNSASTRWLRPDTGQLQTPVAYLICNFAQAQQGKPALLTHDDVITLFHEFGHGLHHMLTQVEEQTVAGIGGVEWDAVELPSQFMENFCWEWAVLQKISSHVDSGAKLPRALYEKMWAAKNYQSGLTTLRQVEFALLDMQLHCQPQEKVMAILQAVRAEVGVLPSAAYSRTAHSFSHIFAGGYAAGYYSYKWAEVLSADAYAAFEEAVQLLAPGSAPSSASAVGQRFLQEILAVGGSRPAMESFRAFRAREPKIDALLRHQGMATPTENSAASAALPNS